VARSTIGADATVRAFLHEQAVEFRRFMCATLLEDGPESAQYASDALSGQVDALARGDAVRISRYELPVGHPLSPPGAGHPCDSLMLGADDVVRER
jgi:hypothetical protein